MSTNSSISFITKSGGKTIYAHWDGYPSWNGKILKNHYKTLEQVEELVSMGNVSVLHEKIGGKVDFDGFNARIEKQCLFYARDRGETGQEATNFSDRPTELHEYNYLFDNGKWYVCGLKGKFVPLTHKLIKEDGLK